MAQAWLVLEMTDSEFLVGVVNAVPALSLLILSPVGGVLADRYNKLSLAKHSRFWVALSTFVTAYLVASGTVELWHLYILGLATGAAFAMGNAATQTLVFDLVGRARMLGAISLNTMVSNIGTVIGPAVGGVLIATVGVGGAFWLLTGIYLIGFVTLFWIPKLAKSQPKPEADKPSPMQDIKDGLKYSFGTPGINWLMVLMMTIMFWGATQPIIPVYARDILDVGADGFGYIFGAGAAGALVAAIAIFLLGDVKNKPRWILVTIYVFALTNIGFAYSTNFPLSLFLYFIGGIGLGVWATFMFTLIQTAVTDEMRGRVVGVASASLQLLGVGYLLGGALSELFSPPTALVVVSIAWLVVTNFAFIKSKELRALS